MISTFKDTRTADIFHGKRSKKLPPSIHRTAMRKLWILDAAMDLTDLRIPPGNRLEKLSGDLAGYHSIRVNEQWRICFRWNAGNAHDVHIIDYH